MIIIFQRKKVKIAKANNLFIKKAQEKRRENLSAQKQQKIFI